MTNVDVEEYLKRNGWKQYDGPNNWFHRGLIKDNNVKADYSYYAMTTDEAYKRQYEWDKENEQY